MSEGFFVPKCLVLPQNPAPKLEFFSWWMDFLMNNASLVSPALVPDWTLYHQTEVVMARVIFSDTNGFLWFCNCLLFGHYFVNMCLTTH